MGLSGRTILNIVELAFYAPAILLAFWVISKHGVGRQSGWIYLAVLAAVRIIGALAAIAANSHPSQGLLETSAIAYGVGLSPLLLAWLGIIKRVNEGMHVGSVPPRVFTIIHLPILIGLIIGIIGSTNMFATNPSSVQTGVTYIKVAVILLLGVLITLSVISIITFMQLRHVIDGEQRLVVASVAVIPFLVVRIAYSIIADFDRSSTLFRSTSDRNAAVVVQGVMSVAMEFIVVSIFLTAGLATPAIPRSMVQAGRDSRGRAPQYKERYGELVSRDHSPMATYPLTGRAPAYVGHDGDHGYGMAAGYTASGRG